MGARSGAWIKHGLPSRCSRRVVKANNPGRACVRAAWPNGNSHANLRKDVPTSLLYHRLQKIISAISAPSVVHATGSEPRRAVLPEKKADGFTKLQFCKNGASDVMSSQASVNMPSAKRRRETGTASPKGKSLWSSEINVRHLGISNMNCRTVNTPYTCACV